MYTHDYAKEAAEEFMTNLVAGAGDNQRMVSIFKEFLPIWKVA